MSDATALLSQVFGFDAFRPGQAEIVEAVTGDQNVLAIMPTGGGKSLCYQVPALVRPGTAIVVSPLIALMQDQVAALRELGVRAAFLNSTMDYEQARATEYALMTGRSALPVPRHLSLEEAATLPCAGLTAWNCLIEAGGARAGNTVLLLGTGGVSVFAQQMARASNGGAYPPDLSLIVKARTGGENYIETVWGRGYVLRDPQDDQMTGGHRMAVGA